MLSLTSLVLLASALLPLASADRIPHGPARTFAQCQKKVKCSPWDFCPKGTIYVSQNDTRANFTSVQAAIASIPNNTTPYYILIAPGNYTEQLNVTRRGPLYLLGASDRPFKGESLSDINVNTSASSYANDVVIHWNSANYGQFSDNVYTGVLTVGPNLNATLTGSGPTGFDVPPGTPFGCTDFRVYNIDFDNNYVPYSDGPAHALGVSRANSGFYSSGFYSWQDTVSLCGRPHWLKQEIRRADIGWLVRSISATSATLTSTTASLPVRQTSCMGSAPCTSSSRPFPCAAAVEVLLPGKVRSSVVLVRCSWHSRLR